ncbi:flagellar hook-length control protein FliK [Amphritea sp.]|uniref:flagellar hook-length control protein FliK n=1 Tax=Amphritea sp. TaxID=1872502 RepID=UPI0025BCC3C6|nr:flagellar hook-length control protein FliK [Amphritea sp.]
MNQSLSASAGVGSLLGTGAVSVASADTAVQGVVSIGDQATQSFDQSMQQANHQHSAASAEQVQSGQTLPEGGESLPSDERYGNGVSDADVVAQPEGSVDGVKAGEMNQGQWQQELFTAADNNTQDVLVSNSDGGSALQQINQYRDADLSVLADSALKQVGARSDHKAQGAELNAESIRNRFSVGSAADSTALAGRLLTEPESFRGASGALAGNAVPAAEVGLVNQEAKSQQPVEFSVQPTDQGKSQSAASAGIAEGQSLVSSLAQSKPEISSIVAGAGPTLENKTQVESGVVVGTGRSGAEGSDLVERMSSSLQASEVIQSTEKGQGGVGEAGQAPAKNLFAESVAQIVREAGLANEQLSDSIRPAVGSIEEAVSRLSVAAGGVSEAKVGAEALKGESFVKVDGSSSRVEPQLRAQPIETVVQSPVRQAADSAMQSGSALAGVQQVVDNARQQIKSGTESDKLKGIELTGRSEGRQDALLTSFADSLAAAGKVRSTAEPMQMVMPEGTRPGMPAWSQAVNNRVMMMASQNGQFAEIQLDPPELGSLLVKLQVKNEQVSVVFTTPHGSVREAIEQSLPRLREMFAEQGLDLAESSVHDQDDGQQRGSEQDESFVGYQNSSAEESVPEVMHQESLSLVDYYA